MNNYNLTLDEYFSLIQQKIKDKDFTLKVFTTKPDVKISVYLEAVNYLMYEYSNDHNDTRQIFPYILIPNDTDWDFTSISLQEFIEFLARNKSKEIINIDISEFLIDGLTKNHNITISKFDFSETYSQEISDMNFDEKTYSLSIFNFKK